MKVIGGLLLLVLGVQAASAYAGHRAYREYQAQRIADLEAAQVRQAEVLAVNLDLLTYPDDEVDAGVVNAWMRLAAEYALWATEPVAD